MNKIRNNINTNQLGDENKYRSLTALTRIYNSVNEKGELTHGKLIRRSIKLIHEYNEWIKQIEKGIIRVSFGMFGREIKWYEYRCLASKQQYRVKSLGHDDLP